ncbi:unnamed protein product [Aureobasidium mustum]|uniref:Uncharacterized protein n=1 Tax=Aureobasidium mustum TaxID=2773714 RepID=A0A9N8PJK0_9PEZI|nr:unnamed protein product [Aureobasidium mustum]
MFPNNSLGPGRVPPTPEEAVQMRAKCAASIVAALPPIVVKQLLLAAKMKMYTSRWKVCWMCLEMRI